MSHPTCECKRSVTDAETTLQQLKAQWLNNEHCDVVLIVGQDKKQIPVQKAVLAAASQYFTLLFTSDFKEKNKNEIDLSATFYCAETFQNIVAYLYGDKLTISYHNVEKYLHYSEMLSLEDLIESCLKLLLENLNMENSLWTWIIADRYNLNELLDACKDICICYFHSFLAYQDYTFEIGVENLIRLLKQGLARYCKPSQFDTFLNKYISCDSSRISKRTIMMEAYHQMSGTVDVDPNSDRNLDEAVIIKDMWKDELLLIYSSNNDQWYSLPSTLTDTLDMKYFYITSLGVGPEHDHILIKAEAKHLGYYELHKLINTKTLEQNFVEFYGEPEYITRRLNGDVIGLFLVVPQDSVNEYHLCQLDFNKYKWELLCIVYRCGSRCPELRFPDLCEAEDKFTLITKERNEPFSVISLSMSSNQLSDPSTFRPECGCDDTKFTDHWKIFLSLDCVTFSHIKPEHPSFKYHYGSNSWSVTERLEETDLATVNLKSVIGSAYSDNQKIYYIGVRNKFGKYFVSWNPFTKGFKDLCPVPMSKPIIPVRFALIIPARFVSYLEVADRILDLDTKAPLINEKSRKELVHAYRCRTRNIDEDNQQMLDIPDIDTI